MAGQLSNVQVFLPTPGYHIASLIDLQETHWAAQIVADVIKEYWETWWASRDEVMLDMVPKPNPATRLSIYQNKPSLPPLEPGPVDPATGQPLVDPQTGMPVPGPRPMASWYDQRKTFKNDYDADMADWVQLEPNSPRRTQVMRELAGQDLQDTATQAQGPAQLTQAPPFSPTPRAAPPQRWPV